MTRCLPNAWMTLCVLFVPLYTSLSTSLPRTRYGVVLDAGSSGTKVKAYRWQTTGRLSDLPRMELIQSSNLKFRPGIGYFARHQDELWPYMASIISRVNELIPEDAIADTPLYLMATAGARILDARIALGLLNRIRIFLGNSTVNPFSFTPTHVRILSGEEEGVYAWLAVNSLLGFFHTQRMPTESVGVLEMGGGSTQIAFVPQGPLYAEEFQIHVAARRFDLYVHSYLFYGSNYMQRRVNVLTSGHAHSDQGTTRVMCPGDSTTFKDELGDTFEFRGTGNPDLCAEHIRHFLRKASDSMCQPKPCAVGAVYQPSVGNMTFYATQGFVYTLQNVKALGEDRILNITKLRAIGDEYCQKSLDSVIEQLKINRKFASEECFMSLYISLLLAHGYGISDDTNVVKVTNKIDDTRIDWTLGVLLYEQSMALQSERLSLAAQCVTVRPKLIHVNSTDERPDDVGYTLDPGSVRPVASHSGARRVRLDVVMVTLNILITGNTLSRQ
ncbi:ectonucleoside triphosphate diphosphohydrolase 1-like [Gigantopelta aegis]|uniref:ectonucleoside triphosphate diphosphohydrolase 1-like n=1 Tax=Gigantopelta aegis TaxID=1735272 RepID=UPI001B88DEFB|nr:ectonucleoside triphosphate diphosphohydrolase 1-like [Gigantopelta aegis]